MTRRETTLWADLFFFSTINLLVFGLIARHFTGSDPTAGTYVLSGMLLWEIIRLCQYTVTVTSLWNLWSNNLSNLFITPVSLTEFVLGNVLSAAAKTMFTFAPLALATVVVFDFNILDAGILPLSLALLILMVFACSLGLLLLGLIFRYGVRVQAAAWSAVYLFQPVIGVYFPLSVLPDSVEAAAQIIPATHVFIGVRNAVLDTGAIYPPLLLGGAMSLVGFAAGYAAFVAFFRRSKFVGQFARLES